MREIWNHVSRPFSSKFTSSRPQKHRFIVSPWRKSYCPLRNFVTSILETQYFIGPCSKCWFGKMMFALYATEHCVMKYATHTKRNDISIFIRHHLTHLPLYSATYIRQWTGSALVQIMACRLFGLPGTNLVKFERNSINLIQENAFEIVLCQNGDHFVQGR